MSRPSNILISTIHRNQRFRGPSSSDQQNDFQAEVLRDLTTVQQQWNNNIVTLTSTLPDGTDDSGVNAFLTGLDGQTLYAKFDATNTLGSSYFNTIRNRPNTLYEQFVSVYSYIDSQIATLQSSIDSSEIGTGITADQKERIGDHIFDLSLSSSASSLDGKVTSQSGYILQLARDVYGTSSPTLNSSGTAVLNNSVRAMVDALLELHNGNWDNDITVNHSFLAGVTNQIAVFDSSTTVTSYSDFNWNPSTSRLGVNSTTPNSTIHIAGSVSVDPIVTSSSVSVGESAFSIFMDATSGNKTVTLPTGLSVPGRMYVIKKIDSSSNTVTVGVSGGDTIDGSSTYVIGSRYESIWVQATSIGYFIL